MSASTSVSSAVDKINHAKTIRSSGEKIVKSIYQHPASWVVHIASDVATHLKTINMTLEGHTLSFSGEEKKVTAAVEIFNLIRALISEGVMKEVNSHQPQDLTKSVTAWKRDVIRHVSSDVLDKIKHQIAEPKAPAAAKKASKVESDVNEMLDKVVKKQPRARRTKKETA